MQIPAMYRARLTFAAEVPQNDGTKDVHDSKTWDGATCFSAREAEEQRLRLVQNPPFEVRLVWSAVIVSSDGGWTWTLHREQ